VRSLKATLKFARAATSLGIKNMGKKRIIQKTEKELIEETEKIEAATKKEIKMSAPVKAREGKIFISSSYNNTIITLADNQGNVLSWASAGSIGFKGTKKATPFAASKVAEVLAQMAKKLGIEKIQILIKGVGSGRDSAIRSLAARGLDIISVKDVTPVPHNGCRPPKTRRV
jgi:small subunit ribosomal protein S11